MTATDTTGTENLRQVAFELSGKPRLAAAYGILAEIEEASIHGAMLVAAITEHRDAAKEVIETGEKLILDTQRNVEAMRIGRTPRGASDQLMGDHARAIHAVGHATQRLSNLAGMITMKNFTEAAALAARLTTAMAYVDARG